MEAVERWLSVEEKEEVAEAMVTQMVDDLVDENVQLDEESELDEESDDNDDLGKAGRDSPWAQRSWLRRLSRG